MGPSGKRAMTSDRPQQQLKNWKWHWSKTVYASQECHECASPLHVFCQSQMASKMRVRCLVAKQWLGQLASGWHGRPPACNRQYARACKTCAAFIGTCEQLCNEN